MKLNEDYFDDIEITDDDLSVEQTDENYQYSLIIQFKTQTGTIPLHWRAAIWNLRLKG